MSEWRERTGTPETSRRFSTFDVAFKMIEEMPHAPSLEYPSSYMPVNTTLKQAEAVRSLLALAYQYALFNIFSEGSHPKHPKDAADLAQNYAWDMLRGQLSDHNGRFYINFDLRPAQECKNTSKSAFRSLLGTEMRDVLLKFRQTLFTLPKSLNNGSHLIVFNSPDLRDGCAGFLNCLATASSVSLGVDGIASANYSAGDLRKARWDVHTNTLQEVDTFPVLLVNSDVFNQLKEFEAEKSPRKGLN